MISADLTSLLALYQGRGREALLPVLWDIHHHYGYVSAEAAQVIGHTLHVPLADIYGVIEFYAMFYDRPTGKRIIRVCQDPLCALVGSADICQALSERLHIEPGETTADGAYTLELAPCLGQCDHAPAALVNTTAHGHLHSDRLDDLLQNTPTPLKTRLGGMLRIALANVGQVDPASLQDYRDNAGFAGLYKALSMSPAEIIKTISDSGLLGRGGAAFPAGRKWEFTAKGPGQTRYFIVNGDESEPGAFKDRVLMEGDPFRILEGLMIGCYAIGATQGYIYIRGEYQLPYERIQHAVDQLYAAGMLGANALGPAKALDIEVRRGAGAYICGEETALMESIEGKRGMPRLRPPFPTTYGLFGQPTVINNIETVAKIAPIMLHGAAFYRGLGTSDAAGSKLFAVSGCVRRPGVYEVVFGVPLRHIIEELAGGALPGRTIQAVLTGGAAGRFMTADQLDTPVNFDSFRQAGGSVGAGTLMVFDDAVDLRQVLAQIAHFFAHESCGKCYPCQMGTQRQLEILQRLAHRQPAAGDRERLIDLAATMTDSSICGLGQTAAMATLSAMERWPELLFDGDRRENG
ncbi:MAG: NADH-quinone oxidoreductase subunit E [Chloroflexi bacterium]|nr:NADH-quinone oxidoreductase subunit E [Chloroflexota bacterium]